MGETSNATQGQKPKISRLAITSLLLIILGSCFLVLVVYKILYHLMPFYLSPFYVYGHLVSGLMVIAGIVVGIVAIKKVRNKRGALKGERLAIAGVVMGAVSLVFWFWVLQSPQITFTAQSRCAANLRMLGKAILIYTCGDSPISLIADKWCDLLLEGGYVNEDQFKCPANKKARYSYAMNPNCGPNSPLCMVLLFETKGGWNQFGGPGILTLENHGGKGCNVLFCDGHVEFVKAEHLGDLIWKIEQKSSENKKAR